MYADDATQGSDGDLYLLLDTTTTFTGRYDADVKFWGTDLAENGRIDDPSDIVFSHNAGRGSFQYYWPDRSDDFAGGVSETYYIAQVGFETGGDTSSAGDATADWDTNVYINTATGKPPFGTSSRTGLSNYNVDVNVNSNAGAIVEVDPSSATFAMDERADTSSYPIAGYNEQGTKFVLSNGEFTLTVPDTVRRGIIVLKTSGTTTTTTGGEELTIAKGESGTTSSGSTITVEDITYSASCGAGTGGGEGTCVATPQNYFEPAAVPSQMVFLDNEAPSGGLILVGGHMVNRLSAQVSNIRDLLTASGDGKEPWQDTESGNWLVAGYTADDTVSAASEFISAVESIDMRS